WADRPRLDRLRASTRVQAGTSSQWRLASRRPWRERGALRRPRGAIGNSWSVRSWRPPPCLRRESLTGGDGERRVLLASRAWTRTPEHNEKRSAVRRFGMGEGGRRPIGPGRRDPGRDGNAWRRGFSGHAPLSLGRQSGCVRNATITRRQMQAEKRLTCPPGLRARGYAIMDSLSPAHRSRTHPGPGEMNEAQRIRTAFLSSLSLLEGSPEDRKRIVELTLTGLDEDRREQLSFEIAERLLGSGALERGDRFQRDGKSYVRYRVHATGETFLLPAGGESAEQTLVRAARPHWHARSRLLFRSLSQLIAVERKLFSRDDRNL